MWVTATGSQQRSGCREQKFSSRCKGEKYVLRKKGRKPGVSIKGHQGTGIIGDTSVT